MKLIAIETSCDETSVAMLRSRAGKDVESLSHITHSQAEMHAEYGGVFPAMAKREHTKNIMPIVFGVLRESGMLVARATRAPLDATVEKRIRTILEREPELAELVTAMAQEYRHPGIDAVAVTYGPGLEIALWTGFNVARALSVVWNVALVPVNHMEGHIYSALLEEESSKQKIDLPHYPALALLISGGHTELVLMKDEFRYRIIGQTLDDAVGECYDKSARLLGLPYPGGRLISDLSEEYKNKKNRGPASIELPRPMMHSSDYNFSFSGLKTAVLRMVQNQDKSGKVNKKFKRELSYELEQAIAEVLVYKTEKVIEEFGVREVVVAGGVAANTNIKRELQSLCDNQGIGLRLPLVSLSGDNALMIGLAGLRRYVNKKYPKRVNRVIGNLKIDK